MLRQQTTIRIKDKLLDVSSPKVMGILNVTPDSFYDGGRYLEEKLVLEQCEKMLRDGASLIDIGGMSSRPGAEMVTADEELKRVIWVVEKIVAEFPEALLSIDTVHAEVAKACVEAGAGMVNDISGGNLDAGMWDVVSETGAAYVLMHMKGSPDDMRERADYENVVQEVFDYFSQKLALLREKKITDVLIDPGFGFAKKIRHNFVLLNKLEIFRLLGAPILAGISRKSMIYKTLGITPGDALNGTSALHMLLLQNGSNILRVHDVKEAVEVIRLWKEYHQAD